MAEKITAYFLRSCQDGPYRGYAGEIRNSLKELQRYVGGLIQAVHITPEIIVICNDEGKLQHLPLNRALLGDNSQVIDYFVGDILLVRSSGENFASIRPEDIPVIERLLIPLKSVFKERDHLAFVTYPADYCPEWHE